MICEKNIKKKEKSCTLIRDVCEKRVTCVRRWNKTKKQENKEKGETYDLLMRIKNKLKREKNKNKRAESCNTVTYVYKCESRKLSRKMTWRKEKNNVVEKYVYSMCELNMMKKNKGKKNKIKK